MRYLPLVLVLTMIIAGCGAPDQPPAAPATPKIAPTSASQTQTPPPEFPTRAPLATALPRPLAELPLEEVLFQPGDLPVDQALLMTDKMP